MRDVMFGNLPEGQDMWEYLDGPRREFLERANEAFYERTDAHLQPPSSRDSQCFELGFCRCAGVRVGRVNPDSATVTVTRPPRTSPVRAVRT